jgi:hypothetical protein
MHTNDRISFGRETPNWVTRPTTMTRKQGLYLRWRWSQASGAVASRCSGEATRCRQTCNGEEDDRGRRVPPTGPPPTNKGKMVKFDSKIRQHLPYTGRFPNPAKTWHEGQQPHIYTEHGHEGQHPPTYRQEVYILLLTLLLLTTKTTNYYYIPLLTLQLPLTTTYHY